MSVNNLFTRVLLGGILPALLAYHFTQPVEAFNRLVSLDFSFLPFIFIGIIRYSVPIVLLVIIVEIMNRFSGQYRWLGILIGTILGLVSALMVKEKGVSLNFHLLYAKIAFITSSIMVALYTIKENQLLREHSGDVNKPTGVSILSMYLGIYGVSSLFNMARVIASAYEGMQTGRYSLSHPVTSILSPLLLGSIAIVSCVGLQRSKKWGWWFAISFTVVTLVKSMIDLAGSLDLGLYSYFRFGTELVFYTAILVYIHRESVRSNSAHKDL